MRQLMGRHFRPNAIVDMDLARALPPDHMPSWAAGWHRHPLVVPFYDCEGRLASLHARRLTGGNPRFKAMSPEGFNIAGLVLADDLGRNTLRGGRWLDVHHLRRVGLVVLEGATDLLSQATSYSDADEDAPGHLAIVAGSWTDALAARIPKGVTVTLATHTDDAGRRYAQAVGESLSQCGLVVRVPPDLVSP
jgi:hypothetical protein